MLSVLDSNSTLLSAPKKRLPPTVKKPLPPGCSRASESAAALVAELARGGRVARMLLLPCPCVRWSRRADRSPEEVQEAGPLPRGRKSSSRSWRRSTRRRSLQHRRQPHLARPQSPGRSRRQRPPRLGLQHKLRGRLRRAGCASSTRRLRARAMHRRPDRFNAFSDCNKLTVSRH